MTISDLVPWNKKRQDLAADQGEKDLLPDLRIQMNRLFDEFFERPFGSSSMFSDSPLERDFAPLLDISETDKEITVTAELPGLEPDEIDLTFNQGSLTISGEKHAEQEQEGETYYRIERSYGSFQRTVALPPDVDEDKIKATFKRGVLRVVVPKSRNANKKSRRITVKSS